MEHARSLPEYYYNRPHKRNAFFHQDLNAFLNDLDLIKYGLSQFSKNLRNARCRYFQRILWNDSYWSGDFVRSLTNKNRRRLFRHAFRMFAVLLSSL